MSQLLINQYLNELATLKRVSGVRREGVVSEAFKDLLKAWGRSLNLVFIPQHEFITSAKVRNVVDGALLHDLRVPFGYWEAKDEDDNLDAEIAKKFRRGYPNTNIIFEDSTEAVLFQNGAEVTRCKTDDGPALQRLLELYFGWQRPEIAEFRKAIAQFKADLPAVLVALRARIEQAEAGNETFRTAAAKFLKEARTSINPSVTAEDVREMLIQHILTEDIFAKVFGADDFHRENNVAKALHALDSTFWRGDVKRQTLAALEPYYAAIRSTAALISSHSEKQGFLKAIYENFYKVYNRKAADRLGVVYTPNEIVRFMIESADWLCEKHFKKSLIDRDVNILDPATGTGTFIVELLEHFRGRPEKLAYKYGAELYANEVAILPYYVANLNIEATYAAIVGSYAEFPGLCFVDTLDNVAALGIHRGDQGELFAAISDENSDRVRRQNDRKISVVIGNPPYNAWQENYNNNNANRPYIRIDQHIKTSYVSRGTAKSQIALYDMYIRFFRWASDRLTSDGIIAFVTNRSFIDSKAFDGFRSAISSEFQEAWVVDLGGDVRVNPKLSGTKHNVFGIQAGVAISFLVKREKAAGFRLYYTRRPEFESAEDKLAFLSRSNLSLAEMLEIVPDANSKWLGHSDNDFGSLLPIASPEAKGANSKGAEHTIFKLYSQGVKTQRDDWMWDRDPNDLIQKVSFFVNAYQDSLGKSKRRRVDIKWDRELEGYASAEIQKSFEEDRITAGSYRPFSKRFLYYDRHFNGMTYQTRFIFADGTLRVPAITIMGDSSGKPYFTLAIDALPDVNFVSPASGGTQTFPVKRLNPAGRQVDNITDWALDKFTNRYGTAATITKDDIFAYVYAVLHDPVYRETYALNLKREFPRIPLYDGFERWRAWGQALLDLHIGYEAAAPSGLVRTDTPDAKRGEGTAPAVKLKSDHETGIIVLDSETQLSGVPAEAWLYRLGNRSALDWVLDQHKEKTPKDPTIRARFNTYRFADYKEAVINLLDRVTTVSVETVRITEAMRVLPR